MTQYSCETLPTIGISPFDVDYYPLHSDAIKPFIWEVKADPIAPIKIFAGSEVMTFTGVPRFNPDEILAFIEKGDII